MTNTRDGMSLEHIRKINILHFKAVLLSSYLKYLYSNILAAVNTIWALLVCLSINLRNFGSTIFTVIIALKRVRFK